MITVHWFIKQSKIKLYVENLFICKKNKVFGKFSIINSGDKLHINVCSFDDLLGLPSVGKAAAYKIWELRKSTEITPEILATISHLKMEKVVPLIDFSTSQEIQKVGTSVKARTKVRKDLMII